MVLVHAAPWDAPLCGVDVVALVVVDVVALLVVEVLGAVVVDVSPL